MKASARQKRLIRMMFARRAKVFLREKGVHFIETPKREKLLQLVEDALGYTPDASISRYEQALIALEGSGTSFAGKLVKPKSRKREDFYETREWRELRYLALVRNDGRCECCGASKKNGVRLHVDHIKPRSKYPELELEPTNVQVLCEDCNLGKSNIDETDWREPAPRVC